MKEQTQADIPLILSKNEKIDILDSVLRDLDVSTTTVLQVDISYEPIKENDTDLLYSYTIPGSRINRKTQNSNLLQKLSEISKMEEKKED